MIIGFSIGPETKCPIAIGLQNLDWFMIQMPVGLRSFGRLVIPCDWKHQPAQVAESNEHLYNKTIKIMKSNNYWAVDLGPDDKSNDNWTLYLRSKMTRVQ